MRARARRCSAVALAFATWAARSGAAADAGVARVAGFVEVRDAAALAHVACAPPAVSGPALRDAVSQILEQIGLDPQLAVVFTSEPLVCASLFYVPVANDVEGIGYRHVREPERFDDSPSSRLEGIAFLNDFPYWRAHPEELRTAFNHELSHRFGARVHARIGGVPSGELLGRDGEHWSYFLDSGGSPLEGNAWHGAGDGDFIADSPLGGGAFSELDLYMMGVLEPRAVPPRRLLRPAPSSALDCDGAPLTAASPPQWCAPLELTATETTVTIEDVIAAEGPRRPAATSDRSTLDVAVLLLQSGSDPLTRGDCEAFAVAVEEARAGFDEATGRRLTLRNLGAGTGAPCEALAAVNHAERVGAGCSMARGGSAASPWVALGACLAATRRRRRCPQVSPLRTR